MKEYCIMEFGPKIYSTLHRYNDLVDAKNGLYYFLNLYKVKNYRYFVDNDYFKDNIFSPNETNKRFVTFTLLEREVSEYEKVQYEDEEENSLNEFAIFIKSKHLKYYSKKYKSFKECYKRLNDMVNDDFKYGIIPYVDNNFYNNTIINNTTRYYSIHKRTTKPWKKYYEKETDEKNKIVYFIK